MIWYLLYIFRGTTKPPVLDHTHPLRKAVFYHASAIARHPLRSIHISVIVGILLCYPFPLLYKSTSGTAPTLQFSSWSSIVHAENYLGEADFNLKQVWTFGDYMAALEPRTIALGEAGKTLLEQEAQKPSSSIQLSAPSVWGLSAPGTDDGDRVLGLINSPDRHFNSSVAVDCLLAGVERSKGLITAADTIVASVLTKGSHSDEKISPERLSALRDVRIFPPDGSTTRSNLFEFQHRPISSVDNTFIWLAYLCMGIYFVVCMRKLRAVKSRFGLASTVLIQSFTSVFASLTLCAILGIDLSKMPAQVYPFVVFAIHLENTFRLINVVLVTRPEDSSPSRIANALSKVGHIVLAGSIQNVVVLAILSRFVNPVTRSLCKFAIIGVVIDALFHITFFLAVLSIDLRRVELQDLLEGGRDRRRRKIIADSFGRNGKQKWDFVTLLQSKLPFSTRVAGAATVFFYVVGINSHFTESKSQLTSIRKVIKSMLIGSRYFPPELNLPFRHAESQAAWLMRQDAQFIDMLLNAFTPGKHVALARVYEPLVLVFKNADRNRHIKLASLIPSLPDLTFLQDHIKPLLLTVGLVLGGTALLLNFLLWNEVRDEHSGSLEAPEPLLSVRTLHGGHSLDVVLMTASPHGALASIGFDRRLTVWNLKTLDGQDCDSLSIDLSRKKALWPIDSMCISENGETLALRSGGKSVTVWDVQKSSFMKLIAQTDPKIVVVDFFFLSTQSGEEGLAVVTEDGWLTILTQRTAALRHRVSSKGIVSAHPCALAGGITKILSVSPDGSILSSGKDGDNWKSEEIFHLDPLTTEQPKSITVQPVPALNAALITNGIDVYILDITNGETLDHFTAPVLIKLGSLIAIHAAQKTCSTCGSLSITSFSVVYTEKSDDLQCTIRTYTPQSSHMCLRTSLSGRHARCPGLDKAEIQVHQIEKLGAWQAAGTDKIVGVRVKRTPPSSSFSSRRHTPKNSFSSSSLRLRKTSLSFTSLEIPQVNGTSPSTAGNDNDYEAVCISSNGEVITSPLSTAEDCGSELFVSELGPIVRLSRQSVALGFGPSIKLLMLGTERFEGMNGGFGYGDDLLIGTPGRSRRRPLPSTPNGNRSKNE